jgi:CheY-like chemotaxis protein
MSQMRYLILIVDDETAEAAKVAQIVEALIDCSTERAADRHEALAKLQSKKYDAVIADLNMGGIFEGELLLEAIETRFKVPPGTIIVSVSGSEASARNLKGRFRFITDVFAKDEIEKVIGAFRVALEAAVAKAQVVSEPTTAPETLKRRWNESKIKLWVAITSAIAAIAVAVIKACSG